MFHLAIQKKLIGRDPCMGLKLADQLVFGHPKLCTKIIQFEHIADAAVHHFLRLFH
ncbi:hypothetical protein D3C81_2155470 [compost metagenome]